MRLWRGVMQGHWILMAAHSGPDSIGTARPVCLAGGRNRQIRTSEVIDRRYNNGEDQ